MLVHTGGDQAPTPHPLHILDISVIHGYNRNFAVITVFFTVITVKLRL
jgi:hypothetical protein